MERKFSGSRSLTVGMDGEGWTTPSNTNRPTARTYLTYRSNLLQIVKQDATPSGAIAGGMEWTVHPYVEIEKVFMLCQFHSNLD